MGRRNPNSRHQLCMRMLFGEAAANMPTDHLKWPEPFRGIYLRMLQSGTLFAYGDEIASTKIPKNHHV